MSKEEDFIIVEGVVTEINSGNKYSVKLLDNDMVISATVSGRMRMNKIRILPGDKVTIALSKYDLTLGRITYRYKN